MATPPVRCERVSERGGLDCATEVSGLRPSDPTIRRHRPRALVRLEVHQGAASFALGARPGARDTPQTS